MAKIEVKTAKPKQAFFWAVSKNNKKVIRFSKRQNTERPKKPLTF